MSNQTGTERDVFTDLMEGISAMSELRQGNIKLNTHPLQTAIENESPGIEKQDSRLSKECKTEN